MPTTPVHISFNILIYYLISLVSSVEFLIVNCIYLLIAELIDLDHLLSKPIYNQKRNSFKTHIFHKNWKLFLIISTGLLFFNPTIFLGIGFISHLFLDYIHVKFILPKI